jgi:hypothetical protein
MKNFERINLRKEGFEKDFEEIEDDLEEIDDLDEY